LLVRRADPAIKDREYRPISRNFAKGQGASQLASVSNDHQRDRLAELNKALAEI
jgi:hypothetical protein